LIPGYGTFCVEFACSPLVCVGSLRVLRLPPTIQKDRLIGDSKLYLGMSVSVHGRCGPVMDWRPVQGVLCLQPNERWDRLQQP